MASEEESLETRVETCASAKKHPFALLKSYLVDTSASLLFYTPPMGCMEYRIADMEPKEIAKSRLVAGGVHALTATPYRVFRQWWADLWGVDETSTWGKKFALDTSARVLFQIPVYSTILYLAGVSWEEATMALPFGLTIGAASGIPYGYFLDKWKRWWGERATLYR